MTRNLEEIMQVLKKARIFMAQSIHQYIPHIDYHPMDVAALVYFANRLDVKIPPQVEKRTEEFLSGEITRNYVNMPIREIFWGISFLLARGYTLEQLNGPIEHILTFQNKNGGIGFYKGDVSRIPSTGWFLSTILSKKYKDESVYKIHGQKILNAANFLVNEWNKDVSRGHALSYKGAHVLTSLLGCVDLNIEPQNMEDTIKGIVGILLDMQIENGSWTFLLKQSDVRISSALAAPHTTGRVMLPLCDVYRRENNGSMAMFGKDLSNVMLSTLERGAKYLCETQFDLGFWYAHDAGELAVINGQCALALKEALEVFSQ